MNGLDLLLMVAVAVIFGWLWHDFRNHLDGETDADVPASEEVAQEEIERRFLIRALIHTGVHPDQAERDVLRRASEDLQQRLRIGGRR